MYRPAIECFQSTEVRLLFFFLYDAVLPWLVATLIAESRPAPLLRARVRNGEDFRNWSSLPLGPGLSLQVAWE